MSDDEGPMPMPDLQTPSGSSLLPTVFRKHSIRPRGEQLSSHTASSSALPDKDSALADNPQQQSPLAGVASRSIEFKIEPATAATNDNSTVSATGSNGQPQQQQQSVKFRGGLPGTPEDVPLVLSHNMCYSCRRLLSRSDARMPFHIRLATLLYTKAIKRKLIARPPRSTDADETDPFATVGAALADVKANNNGSNSNTNGASSSDAKRNDVSNSPKAAGDSKAETPTAPKDELSVDGLLAVVSELFPNATPEQVARTLRKREPIEFLVR